MKILVIRFSSIGDIVLTSPVVRCVKQQLGAEVHYLTKEGFFDILSASPHIEKVFTIKKSVSEVLDLLRKEQYDCIIDLHKNLRSLQVQIGLRKRALTFDKGNLAKWYMVALKGRKWKVDHIVMRYMRSISSLGVSYDGAGLDYFIQKNVNDLELPERFVCFAIGGAHATKRLPEEKITEICRSIDLPVILLGGPADVEAAQIITDKLDHVKSLCGRISLSESARVTSLCMVLLTHDTGLMHIAAALRKPIISIWGNTVPEFGMFPFYPEGMKSAAIMQVEGLSCRPCSKIGFDRCPKGHFQCMTQQDVLSISKKVKELVR